MERKRKKKENEAAISKVFINHKLFVGSFVVFNLVYGCGLAHCSNQSNQIKYIIYVFNFMEFDVYGAQWNRLMVANILETHFQFIRFIFT